MNRLLLLVLLMGCPAEEKQGPAPKRFASVKSGQRSAKASKIFCEKTFAPGSKKYVSPPEQVLPGGNDAALKSGGWRWINFWATWCGPCLEEMPLLERWRQTLEKDGADLSFELWTIDEDREALATALGNRRQFPKGQIRWLRSNDDLQAVLDSLGIERDSAIPIHALVDPSGDLRCVRVGSVGANDYGTIKTIIGS